MGVERSLIFPAALLRVGLLFVFVSLLLAIYHNFDAHFCETGFIGNVVTMDSGLRKMTHYAVVDIVNSSARDTEKTTA